MQCKNCGLLMQDEHNYCGNCGRPLEGARISLKDLVAAGMIAPGEKIWCSLKNGRAEATVLADGTLDIAGTVYKNPPEAIAAARGVACDSWHCWKYFDATEKREKPLHSLKGQFRRKKQG